MRVVVWIAEDTWEGCVDRARALLAEDAEITLLHVAPSDVEALASHGGARLLGRHPPPPPGPPLRAIAEEEARSLLAAARDRLGRPAETLARRGKIEREVLEACVGADLLVLARDGEPRLEPKSVGPRTRFVLDHAPCQVLLVWPEAPPSLDTIKLPPHLR
ncbi:MAG TPA: universal stress protein [Solirubrobacteraceae bacterium]|nr:universal stress protein [Solirubrobacteraceae bacterium]